MKPSAQSEAKQEREYSFSDMAQQGFAKTERQATIEKSAKGSGFEETKIEIDDSIANELSIKSLTGENKLMSTAAEKLPDDRDSEERLKDNLYPSPITTEMLIPKYSEGEKNAFCFLHTRSTRNRRLPREWKCLLTYHRLAWNILSKSPQVIPLAGWQVQLIAWVFVCWQWRHLITTLVQNWHDLGVLRKWVMVHDIQKGEVKEENSGPSLREIVEQYIEERWPADKKLDKATKMVEDSVYEEVAVEKTSCNLPEKIITTITSEESDTEGENYLREMVRKVLKEERDKKRGSSLKIKGLPVRSKKGKRKYMEQDELEGVLKLAVKKVLREEEVENMLKVIVKKVLKEEREREKELREVSDSHEEDIREEISLQQDTNQKASDKARKSRKSKAKLDEEEEREEWRKLRETLSRYNVSMDGIQALQKFRFYCDPGHLPWPLPEQA